MGLRETPSFGCGSRGSATPSCRLKVAAKLDSHLSAQHARCTWRPVLGDLAAGRVAGSLGLDPLDPPELNGRQLGLDPCLGLIRGSME